MINKTQNHQSQCEFCQSKITVVHRCNNCKKVKYCSQKCVKYDFEQHRKVCKKNVKVGLVNLGNTCYLNSCLQCLFYTQQLTDYFLEQHYQKQLVSADHSAYHGQVALAYAECIKNIFINKTQNFQPTILKKAIGAINKQFQQFQQQDASQFYATLIDGLRQDLNRVRVKNYESVDIYGKSDEEGAKISWLKYLSSTQSIITDIMTGLQKSVLTCQKCKNESIRFEPFISINLPIPKRKQIISLSIYVLFYHFRKPTIRLTVQYQEVDLQKIFSSALQMVGGDKEQFKLYFLTKKRKIFNICQLTKDLFSELVLIQDAFLIELSPQQRNLPITKSPVCVQFAIKKNKKSKENIFKNLWLKRPFFIDYESQTGFGLKKKVLKYLYNTAYKCSQRRTVFGLQGKSYFLYQEQMIDKIKLHLHQIKTERENLRMDIIYQGQAKTLQDKFKLQVQVENSLVRKAITLDQKKQRVEFIVQFIQDDSFQQFNFNNLNRGIVSMNLNSQMATDANKPESGKQSISIYQCLDAFHCQQQMSDLLNCRWCSQKEKAWKRMSIYKSPDVMVLVLNRFKIEPNGTRSKNRAYVDFPFQLELQKYVKDKKPMCSFRQLALTKIDYKNSPSYNYKDRQQLEVQKFELFGIVNHKGKMNSGHYFSYIKEDGKQWYCFDDNKQIYEMADHSKLKTQFAYMLFYRKKYMDPDSQEVFKK